MDEVVLMNHNIMHVYAIVHQMQLAISHPGIWQNPGTRKKPVLDDGIQLRAGVVSHCLHQDAPCPPLKCTKDPFPISKRSLKGPRSREPRMQKLKFRLLRTQSLKVLALKPGIGQ